MASLVNTGVLFFAKQVAWHFHTNNAFPNRFYKTVLASWWPWLVGKISVWLKERAFLPCDCCMPLSWHKRNDVNVFLYFRALISLFFSIDVLEMLLTQIRQFSVSLWYIWFCDCLVIFHPSQISIPCPLPYHAKYPFVLSITQVQYLG